MPHPLPYFKENIYPFPLPHFASIFFAYLWSFRWPNYIATLQKYFSFRLPHLNIPIQGRIQGGARRAPSLKLETIWFFGVKSWFFTRNTPNMQSITIITNIVSSNTTLLSVTCDRSVVVSGYSNFLHQ
jgi:hypothetical protein